MKTKIQNYSKNYIVWQIFIQIAFKKVLFFYVCFEKKISYQVFFS